ncbi:unnamed protein product [Rotaria magnacalcarata]
MANLTTAVQRLFDSYDPRKNRNDDYICNACEENLKKSKLNHLRHIKKWHKDEFAELLDIQRNKIEENRVQPPVLPTLKVQKAEKIMK